MTPEAPEFHTEISTPLSPIPLHPQSPSNVTILRTQVNPLSNMTDSLNDTVDDGIVVDEQSAEVAGDSSFEDAYSEGTSDDKIDSTLEQPTTASHQDDDYAMTFESDQESNAEKDSEIGDSQDQEVPTASTDQVDSVPMSSEQVPPTSSDDLESSAPTATTTTEQDPFHDNLTNETPSHEVPVQTAPTETQKEQDEDEEIKIGEVDIQQLLDNIAAKTEMTAPTDASTNPISAAQAFSTATPGLPPTIHSSLPPRPVGLQNPLPFASFPAPDASRTPYTGYNSLPPPPGIGSFRAPGVPGAPGTSGAPGTAPPGLAPPSLSTMLSAPPGVTLPTIPLPVQTQYHDGSLSGQQTSRKDRVDGADPGEVKWSATVQKMYEQFLEDERGYVQDGQWDKFPYGSRLFIGNLLSERVTKRDIFATFYQYGKLAQISIKQAFGFVQFLHPESCNEALTREQGAMLRGRKMHLEISKPQKNSKQGNGQANATSTQRARSPDARGGRGNQQSRNGYNHNDSYGQDGRRGADFGGARGRDEYRPGYRSPSPPYRGGLRGRDDYNDPRGARDSYRRSRSRSPPYGRRDGGRYRDRSPSPRSRELSAEARLDVPRRRPQDVPDVFIIVVDELDRAFVQWVDGEIRSRGLKTEIFRLTPRISLPALLQRQIVEGVHAVTQLTFSSQNSSKIPLQIFDQRAGANNVDYKEYADIEPRIAAELALRSKQESAVPVPSYAQAPYQAPQPYQAPAPAAPPLGNLASLVGKLDNASLQQLLGSLGTQQQQQTAASQQNSQIDLAGILGSLNKQAVPQQNYQQQAHPQVYEQPRQNGAPYGAAPPAQTPQDQQQVQNIMAQLARFR